MVTLAVLSTGHLSFTAAALLVITATLTGTLETQDIQSVTGDKTQDPSLSTAERFILMIEQQYHSISEVHLKRTAVPFNKLSSS